MRNAPHVPLFPAAPRADGLGYLSTVGVACLQYPVCIICPCVCDAWLNMPIVWEFNAYTDCLPMNGLLPCRHYMPQNNTKHFDLNTSPLQIGEQSIAMSVSVCLMFYVSACLCASISLQLPVRYSRSFCACCLHVWLWIDTSLAALPYAMHFWFMDDVMFTHTGRHIEACK